MSYYVLVVELVELEGVVIIVDFTAKRESALLLVEFCKR